MIWRQRHDCKETRAQDMKSWAFDIDKIQADRRASSEIPMREGDRSSSRFLMNTLFFRVSLVGIISGCAAFFSLSYQRLLPHAFHQNN